MISSLMISNLELALCGKNYKEYNEPSMTSNQKQIVCDIFPDTSDGNINFKLPFHFTKKFKSAS